MRNVNLTVLATVLLLTTGVFAQPELDTTFNFTGIQTVSVGMPARADDIAVQADDKIIVAGHCEPQTDKFQFCLARYNADGSLDATFGNNGVVATNVSVLNYGYASALTIQPDGKIVVVGNSKTSQSSDSLAMVRYNSNGTLDQSFGPGGIVVDNPGVYSLTSGRSVTIQPDGKILVAGQSDIYSQFPPVPFEYRGWVARYHANGARDSSFGNGGTYQITMTEQTKAEALTVRPDGKIMVGGSVNSPNETGPRGSLLIRLNPDGSPDTAWDGDGTLYINSLTNIPHNISVQADGRVIALIGSYIARLNGDGSFDTSFDGDGISPGMQATASDMAIDANGKITIVGTILPYSVAISRLNPDGSYDTTFSDDGILTFARIDGTDTAAGLGIAADRNGRLVIGGYIGARAVSRFACLRLKAAAGLPAEIYGRVTDIAGLAIRDATIKTNAGGMTLISRTNAFGYYRLPGVVTGQIYTLSVSAKRQRFTQQIIQVGNQFESLDFVAQEGFAEISDQPAGSGSAGKN